MKHVTTISEPSPQRACHLHQTPFLDALESILNAVLAVGQRLLPFLPEKEFGGES